MLFGLNHQDVLDESYCKAGKLDVGKFSWPFIPASRSNFTVQLVSGLFSSDFLHKGTRSELNVYLTMFSANAFFTYHTSRVGTIFQSLPRYPSQLGHVCLLPHTKAKTSFSDIEIIHVRWKSAPSGSSSSFNCLGGLLRSCRIWGCPCDIWSSYKHYILISTLFGGPVPQATSEHLFKSALKK